MGGVGDSPLTRLRDAIRRRGIVRSFRWYTKYLRPKLVERYGETFADEVIADASEEIERVAPTIPYIGGLRNAFSPVLLINSWAVSLHRAFLRRGLTARDTISVAAELSDDLFEAMSPKARRSAVSIAFGATARRYFRSQAARSQKRRYAEDFVYKMEETEDGEFSFVFSECAVNKFYDANGFEDLKPYCNFFDLTYSRILDMGCDASETIGTGCSQCALRFKHGRETEIPERLVGVMPKT